MNEWMMVTHVQYCDYSLTMISLPPALFFFFLLELPYVTAIYRFISYKQKMG